MNQEEQRYIREGFASDEEFSLYDMLFREDLRENVNALSDMVRDISDITAENVSLKVSTA